MTRHRGHLPAGTAALVAAAYRVLRHVPCLPHSPGGTGGHLPPDGTGICHMCRLFHKLVFFSDTIYNIDVLCSENDLGNACKDLELPRALHLMPGHLCYKPRPGVGDQVDVVEESRCGSTSCSGDESIRNSPFALHTNCSHLCDKLDSVISTSTGGCCLATVQAARSAWWASIQLGWDFKAEWSAVPAAAAWRGEATVFREPRPCQAAAAVAADERAQPLPVEASCFFERQCNNHNLPLACCKSIPCTSGYTKSAGSCYCRCEQGFTGRLCDQARAHALVDVVLRPLSIQQFQRQKQEMFKDVCVASAQAAPADFEYDSIDNRWHEAVCLHERIAAAHHSSGASQQRIASLCSLPARLAAADLRCLVRWTGAWQH